MILHILDTGLGHSERNAIEKLGYWLKLIHKSLSIITLIPAILIFSFVPTLHCARNFIHTNLMISFFLRKVSKTSKN